jgi:hypothetical protein
LEELKTRGRNYRGFELKGKEVVNKLEWEGGTIRHLMAWGGATEVERLMILLNGIKGEQKLMPIRKRGEG